MTLDVRRTPRDEQVLQVTLTSSLGLRFDGRDEGVVHAHFIATQALCSLDTLHAGALYALLDVTSLLALIPHLDDTQHGVTNNFQTSLMKPVRLGARVELRARVLRAGKSLAFLQAWAEVDGQMVASAHVSKSVVAAGPPLASTRYGSTQ